MNEVPEFINVSIKATVQHHQRASALTVTLVVDSGIGQLDVMPRSIIRAIGNILRVQQCEATDKKGQRQEISMMHPAQFGNLRNTLLAHQIIVGWARPVLNILAIRFTGAQYGD